MSHVYNANIHDLEIILSHVYCLYYRSKVQPQDILLHHADTTTTFDNYLIWPRSIQFPCIWCGSKNSN